MFRILLPLLIATLALGGANAALADDDGDTTERECRKAKPDERFTVDFRELPLLDFARMVSCAADVNVMFVPASLGTKKVTVISARPVKLRGLLQLFSSTLVQHQLEMTRRGSYWYIKPVAKR